jgi:hypothetical protein
VIGDARLISKGYGKTLMASLPPFSITRERQVAETFLISAIDTKATMRS